MLEGYAAMESGGNHVDAVVAGCSFNEVTSIDGSVGAGRPNDYGVTTLDAMVMDGLGYFFHLQHADYKCIEEQIKYR